MSSPVEGVNFNIFNVLCLKHWSEHVVLGVVSEYHYFK